MSNQWHYNLDGAQYGPVDETEVIRLIQEREVPPGVPVCKEGGEEWLPARDHACFRVEVYPKGKRPVKSTVPRVTTPKPASSEASQPVRRRTAAQSTTTTSPPFATAPVQQRSVLPWVVAVVAVTAAVFLALDKPTPEKAQPKAEEMATETKVMPPPDPGVAEAHARRGDNYYFGQGGVSQDYAEALKWYRKAADMGHAHAQFGLGTMYRDGEGVLEDDVEAVKWYRKAALQGNARAQYSLGLMYGNGEGVPENIVTAYAWFNIAAAKGVADAVKNKDIAAKRLTPAQIIEAQALSRRLSNSIRTP